ncbi:vitamin B12 dependent-methionine synthase activation domain-containing protein [Sunxiuqinia sp. A32]|uniref:vitamin B12 dependent-methionine synthase activation domain-containing protein n=1 Tax=Sunxiuqinia sp. A32 TaxID=3461496 RepID=UPI0040455202
MIYTNNFRFDELTIDLSEVNQVLGYESQDLPEPFLSYLHQALDDCKNLDDIHGSYYLANQCEIKGSEKSIVANDVVFKVGKTICKELTGATKLAFFICTAGQTISKKSAELMKGEDPVFGYVYDVLGSVIAEAVADKIQHIIKEEVNQTGDKITNRYSPGYCHWNVSDQPNLFSLFNGSTGGVSLTPSYLMTPVKSVSGIIGIGQNVKFRDYQCSLCNLQNCIYRNVSTR